MGGFETRMAERNFGMKILYIAKHGPHDNCDEDAITFGLNKLGHEVICISEETATQHWTTLTEHGADFILIHKWNPPDEFLTVNKIPLVAWDFDMVESSEPTLRDRCQSRISRHVKILPHLTLAFFTDGDWVAKDRSGKLVHLMQGADERFGPHPEHVEKSIDILFTGSIRHGNKRATHIEELQRIYGPKIQIIGNGSPKSRVYGKALAELFAKTKIVIAPDGPSTDNYWSNRVYLTLGLGGFLIHPLCSKLTQHYDEHELTYYENRKHLIELIDYYLAHNVYREAKAKSGHKATLERNLYRHRCETLIETVKERL